MTTSPAQPMRPEPVEGRASTSSAHILSIWQDPDADASTRLDALIADMSLPEKLAQLGSVWLGQQRAPIRPERVEGRAPTT